MSRTTKQVSMFGMQIDVVDLAGAAAEVLRWTEAPAGPCRFVVTPNVDHVVQFQRNAALRAAYADAGMVLADGFPVVVASRLLRRPLPQRVAGSDLVPALFQAAHEGGRSLRVFLLGAAPGVAERAALAVEKRWPSIDVTGCYSPPLGFEHDDEENAAILERIGAVPVDVLVVGLGAPKQELWVHRHFRDLPAPAALCVGATIDFLAGEKPRAPRWMQRLGLEWCHRLLREPRRLARRYAHDAWVFPRLLWREWRT